MFGRDVDDTAAAVSPCGMSQLECAVNPALGFELTLDLDPVSGQEREIGRNLEALRGEIYEGAETGGSVAMHEAPPVDQDANVPAWIGHERPFFLIDQSSDAGRLSGDRRGWEECWRSARISSSASTPTTIGKGSSVINMTTMRKDIAGLLSADSRYRFQCKPETSERIAQPDRLEVSDCGCFEE